MAYNGRLNFGVPKNVNLGFEAFPQAEIVGANFEPTPRFLIEIQTPSDFDDPAIIEADFPVVHIRVKPYVQLDIKFQETLPEFVELFYYLF